MLTSGSITRSNSIGLGATLRTGSRLREREKEKEREKDRDNQVKKANLNTLVIENNVDAVALLLSDPDVVKYDTQAK